MIDIIDATHTIAATAAATTPDPAGTGPYPGRFWVRGDRFSNRMILSRPLFVEKAKVYDALAERSIRLMTRPPAATHPAAAGTAQSRTTTGFRVMLMLPSRADIIYTRPN